MALWRRNGEYRDLEARLRDERPRAPEDLVARFRSRAAPPAFQRRIARARYGIAFGFTAALAAAFVALGGIALLPGGHQQSTRLVVSVPAKAVPVLRTLQARGVRLVATPVLVGQADGAKTAASDPHRTSPQGVTGAERIRAIELDTDHPLDTSKLAARDADKPRAGVAIRLVPQATSGASAIRLPAANVFVPGPSTVLCLRVPIPPDVYYFTVIVPLTAVPALLAQYPGTTPGPCPLP